MALGKPSKKTQKTKAEVPSKTKTATVATKARTPEPMLQAEAKDSLGTVPSKGLRKSSAAVKVDSALQENGITHSATNVPKTMAATAGHSGPDTSTLTVASTPQNGVDGPHAPGHSNGSHHGLTREAIAQRAYFYWAERGYTHGSAEEDWKRAEADLAIK